MGCTTPGCPIVTFVDRADCPFCAWQAGSAAVILRPGSFNVPIEKKPGPVGGLTTEEKEAMDEEARSLGDLA